MMIEISGSTPTDRSEVSEPQKNPRGLKIPLRAATLAAAALLVAGLAACGPGDEGDNDANQANQNQANQNDDQPAEVDLDGAFNKGPFVLGSSVDVSPTDDEANPTGETFSTETDNHLGEFSLNFTYEGLARIEGNGFYYNEAIGELSDAALTLRALENIEEGGDVDAFVNIITHLSYQRIVSLLEEGEQFDEAVDQAEEEIQTAMALDHVELDEETRGTDMNIVGEDSTEYAYLFAVSSILAWATDGEDSELQSVVNNAASQMEMNGEISGELADRLEDAQRELPIPYIEDLFEDRLAEIGAADEPVPSLDEVVDSSGDGHANAADGCPHLYTPDQTDSDDSGIPDACDCGDHRCFEPEFHEFDEFLDINERFIGLRPVIRDLTGDGNLDLLLATEDREISFANGWRLVPGDGEGGFEEPVELDNSDPERGKYAGVANFGDTEQPDILVATFEGLYRTTVSDSSFDEFELLVETPENMDNPCDTTEDCDTYMECSPEGVCIPETEDDTPKMSSPFTSLAGDLTGNGEPELVVSNGGSQQHWIDINEHIAVVTSDGEGQFEVLDSFVELEGTPGVLEDFTEDGNLDLGVTSREEDERFLVYPGTGDGTFEDPVAFDGNAGSGAVGDLTDNGHLDVVGTDCEILEGDGTGEFTGVELSDCEPEHWDAETGTVAELAGDDQPDIVSGLERYGTDFEDVEVFHGEDGEFNHRSYPADPDKDPRLDYVSYDVIAGEATESDGDDLVLLLQSIIKERDDDGEDLETVDNSSGVLVIPGGPTPGTTEE